jgi:hypothetical protein
VGQALLGTANAADALPLLVEGVLWEGEGARARQGRLYLSVVTCPALCVASWI